MCAAAWATGEVTEQAAESALAGLGLPGSPG
jgi:hypothetical protein